MKVSTILSFAAFAAFAATDSASALSHNIRKLQDCDTGFGDDSNNGQAAGAGAGGGNESPAGGDGGSPATGGNGSPAASGNGESPATDGNGKSPAASGNGESPAASGNGESPATDGNDKSPAASGNGESPAASGNGDNPVTVGDYETPAGDDESPAGSNESPAAGSNDASAGTGDGTGASEESESAGEVDGSSPSVSGDADEPIGSTQDDTTSVRDGSAARTDPSQASFNLTALAIGDWGTRYNSCCNKYERHNEDHYKDQQAQDSVAYLLSLSAEALNPKCIIGHGDNFYWNGIASADVGLRFEETFENKYDQESLLEVPWYNVLGNHDYGGANYICGHDDNWRECESVEEMLASIDDRFNAQSQYTSPNNDRWHLPGHYYKASIEDEATGVTVDVFNVDTNAAVIHGSDQICCQCYGYQSKEGSDKNKNCNMVHRGDDLCYGGDTEAFDQCMAKFDAWTKESLDKMAADAAASTATWKIVNSHYVPHFHFSADMINEWNAALHDNGVNLLIGGHTHAFALDKLQREGDDFQTYFVTNGAGGGIQSEMAGPVPTYAKDVSQVWRPNGWPYGFFELSFAQDWMKMTWTTFDDEWKFEKDESKTVRGGRAQKFCYLVPKDSSVEARECTE